MRPAPHDPLLEEQNHLAEARAALARMRERHERLDSSAAGDWVSQLSLEAAMAQRRRALADDPGVPLFFGRLDYDPDHSEDGVAGGRFYVGRRHVTDDGGDPLVVDWRAPVSGPFYRASAREPMGVRLRRRFGFREGRITAFEDEPLVGAEARPEQVSRLLEEEIERPRVGAMRDIVATIQPEQDIIVRAPLSETLCVQGAPGTGKTAVGLHRAAYLLYAHRERLARQKVLVVGPNSSFLRYIGDVLPALGEIDAEQATIESLAERTLTRLDTRHTVRGEDPSDRARLKGDGRMAEVLARAVWGHVGTPEEPLVVPRGSRRWRVPADEVQEILDELCSRGVRYGSARAMLAQRLAHAVLVRMEDAGESPDDRVQDAVARSRPVREYANALWPAVDPARLVHRLLSDADLLALRAAGLLDDPEQALLRWPRPPRAAVSTPWSLADAVLVDEAQDLVERTPSLGHVVVDEAQDLSPMMLRALGRRCSTGSATVLGDLAQATTPWAVGSWEETLRHLGKPGAHVEELTRGFRVPGEVIDFASRLLPEIAPDLRPPESVRRNRGELEVVRTTADGLHAAVVAAVGRAAARPGSTGVIVPDASVQAVGLALSEAGHSATVLGQDDEPTGLELVPATLAKGLEFDHVVVVEPAAITAAEPDTLTGLRRIYVCLTRAVTSLAVVHSTDLPGALATGTGT